MTVTTLHTKAPKIVRTVTRESLQERVRRAFKDRVDSARVSHEVLGNFLGLSRSGVTRLLNDVDAGFGLHHIERLCEFFQVSPAEVCADPAAAIIPVSPLEASLLDRFRKMTEMQRMSLMAVLDWRGEIPGKRGRPSHSHEDAMVLALYRAVAPDVQAAVLGLMREHPSAKQLDARRRLQKS